MLARVPTLSRDIGIFAGLSARPGNELAFYGAREAEGEFPLLDLSFDRRSLNAWVGGGFLSMKSCGGNRRAPGKIGAVVELSGMRDLRMCVCVSVYM